MKKALCIFPVPQCPEWYCIEKNHRYSIWLVLLPKVFVILAALKYFMLQQKLQNI